MDNIFLNIKETSKYVIDHAKNVHINYSVIDEILARGITTGKYWGESNIFGFLDLSIDKIVNFMLLYQAIGFCFWGLPKWTITTENNEKYDGSTALMYVFVSNIDFFSDFKKVENMTLDEFKKFMAGNVEIPLLQERYEILVNVSKIVNEKMNGNFYEYTKNAVRDIDLINIIINNFPSFRDTRIYLNKEIYFYKLASLLTSDILHARAIKEGIKVDYSNIAGCSDYKIPQILRALKITEYSDYLCGLVDSQELIPENDPLEVEIRASVIEVERYIVEKTNICGIEINDFLWLKSKEIKSSKPYHLTKTTSY